MRASAVKTACLLFLTVCVPVSIAVHVMIGYMPQLLPPTHAQPSLPMLFEGAVTLNGAPAPDGAMVTAKVGEEVRGTTMVSNGRYDDLTVNGASGETISFYLNNLASSQTATIEDGKRGLPQTLDLTFTGELAALTTTTATFSTATVTVTTPIPEFVVSWVLIPVILGLALLILRRTRSQSDRQIAYTENSPCNSQASRTVSTLLSG